VRLSQLQPAWPPITSPPQIKGGRHVKDAGIFSNAKQHETRAKQGSYRQILVTEGIRRQRLELAI
jgi:hypothetical protein